ncbi:hypothetical protein, partial [Alistipes shahii]|uniref:hypothetical protein n=1 Tax=Alistipes shahii TaxID=328814 RepID=UPI003A8AFBE9
KKLCLCNFRMSDGIVFFGLFSRHSAGRFFSGRQIAGKGAKTGWFAENIAPTKQIYSPKVAQTGNKSYFCSLKER